MKKTVLYDEHIKLGAKMVEYAGYWMPVEYQGITAEHLAVRNACGVFDVSHMGEILIRGKDAKKFVNYLVTSEVPKTPKKMAYGMLLYEHGGIVDDLMVYFRSDEDIMLVVNASNKDKDYEWIKSHQAGYDVEIIDASDETSLLAVQGPSAAIIIANYTTYDLDTLRMFNFDDIDLLDLPFIVSRSGYTGEDGFEIYGSHDAILTLFKKLIDDGVTPCGLGCRDTLRFEANMPLYGHEIDQDINPLEATLTFALALDKDFIGKEAILAAKAKGITRKVVGIELLDKGIARAGYEVLKEDQVIGYITTGYMIPGTNKAYALAMLNQGNWEIGTEVLVKIRKNLVPAKVRDKKFLNKKYKK